MDWKIEDRFTAKNGIHKNKRGTIIDIDTDRTFELRVRFDDGFEDGYTLKTTAIEKLVPRTKVYLGETESITFEHNGDRYIAWTTFGDEYLKSGDYSIFRIQTVDNSAVDIKIKISNVHMEERIEKARAMAEFFGLELVTEKPVRFRELLEDLEDKVVPEEVLDYLKEKGLV